MRIRRYVAASLPAAVAQVRKELGTDAVILEVRRVRAPGLKGWFSARRVEVTAAGAEHAPVTVPATPPVPPSRGGNREPGAAPFPTWEQLRGRSAALAARPPGDLPERLREPYEAVQKSVDNLVRQGVNLDLARSLVDKALAGVPAEKLSDGAALRQALREEILHLFPAAPADPLQGRVVAFIGPTGVGKTTTIAKLAAIHSLQRGQRVALITADTYRIAAVEQLRRYAEILRLPLEVVFTPDDLSGALARHEGADLVLMDTAGRSPAQGLHLAELRNLLARCPEAQTVLVVSATTKTDDLERVFERFAPLQPNQLVFTKLDETTTPGSVLNLVERTKMPVGYLTNGQNVPDDLEVARPERLVELILGGERHA